MLLTEVSKCAPLRFPTYKKAFPSESLAKSLLEISEIKDEALDSAKLDELNVNAYLPMAYDALREVLEALCILHSYKVMNHICLGELLKKLEPDFDYASFDRFRYARNGINYYGKKVDFQQGRDIIGKIRQMRKNIILKVSSKLKRTK